MVFVTSLSFQAVRMKMPATMMPPQQMMMDRVFTKMSAAFAVVPEYLKDNATVKAMCLKSSTIATDFASTMLTVMEFVMNSKHQDARYRLLVTMTQLGIIWMFQHVILRVVSVAPILRLAIMIHSQQLKMDLVIAICKTMIAAVFA